MLNCYSRIQHDKKCRVLQVHTNGEANYKYACHGSELVSWMVSRHEANSREDAVTELRMLLENNIIRHGTGIMCLLELKYKFCVYYAHIHTN